MKMGTVIGKLDRKYNSIAVGDTVGIEVDGRTVTYIVDSFGGLVKEDGTRLAVDEQNEERLLAMKNALEDFRREVADLRKALGCLEAAQKSLAGDVDDAVSAVAALRSESGLLEEGAVGRGLDTFTNMELAAELERRGYAGMVSKVIRIDAC